MDVATVGTQVGIHIKNTPHYEFRRGWRGFLIGFQPQYVYVCLNKIKGKIGLGNAHKIGKIDFLIKGI